MADDNRMREADPTTTREDPMNPDRRNPSDTDRDDPERAHDTRPNQLPSQDEEDDDFAEFDEDDSGVKEPRPDRT